MHTVSRAALSRNALARNRKEARVMNAHPFARALALVALFSLGLALIPARLHADAVSWDGGDTASENWSATTNWSDDADPAGDDITFDNTAAQTQGTVTNIVDTSYTVSSLRYQNYNTDGGTSAHHYTQIPSGRTLTVDGPGGVTIGGHSATTGYYTYATLAGEGTFTVNNSSASILVWNEYQTWQYSGGVARATLDMHNLATFNATASSLVIGNSIPDASRPRGTVWLAQDNSITLDTLQMGGSQGSEGPNYEYLYLGPENDLNVDTFYIGTRHSTYAEMAFAGGLDSPQVTVRGKAGGDSRADMYVGYIDHSTSVSNAGTVNWDGGEVDARFENLVLGLNQSFASGSYRADGSLQFSQGIIDATTVTLAQGWSGTHSVLTVGGSGVLKAANLYIGRSNSAAATATVNLSGGTIEAGLIRNSTAGGYGNTPVRALNFNSGTIRNQPDANLTISELTVFNLAGADDSHVFQAQSGYSIIVNTAMSGDGGFEKTGEGTLELTYGNTYTGDTTVSAGTLKLTHASNNNIASSATVTVTSPAVLDVTGLSGGVLQLAASQTLAGDGTANGGLATSAGTRVAPGGGVGTLTIDLGSTAAGVTLAANTLLDIELAAPGDGDLIRLLAYQTGDLTLGGAIVNLTDAGGVQKDAWYPLFTFFDGAGAPVAHNLSSGLALGNVPAGFRFLIDYAGEPTMVRLYVIPEPTSVALLALAGLALRRRRR
ncbi:MAG: Autotransporter-associated beta strand repeat protein [Lentisphaerae bacterium ADurb.BinA184]|nr:MAG: Autotransporter-associated beta strand repeat protein [Lentisphaerae bacterium ADurb.BinA184]